MSHTEYERRTFYACELCDLVYAGFEPPEACEVCDGDLFVEVVPEEV